MQPQKRTKPVNLETLKTSLEAQRAEIAARIVEINAALGEFSAAPVRRIRLARVTRSRLPARKPPGTLEELIVEVTQSKPLTPQEILLHVRKAGYVTTSSEPLKIINTVLARSKQLKNVGRGKYGPSK